VAVHALRRHKLSEDRAAAGRMGEALCAFFGKGWKELASLFQCTSRRIGLAGVSTTRASSPRLRS